MADPVRDLWSRLSAEGSFAGSVGLLSGGTLIGRALVFLALPLLTRLYSPEDFGLLAVYLALLAILSVGACLRFEVAIPIPASEADAARLLVLALISATAVALILGVAVVVVPQAIAGLLRAPGLEPLLWLVPVGVWGGGVYAAIQLWATRKRRFGAIGRTRVTQAGAGVGLMLGLGWAGVAPLGLLLGHVVTACAGFVTLGLQALRSDPAAFRSMTGASLRRTAWTYRRFPTYSTTEAFANIVGSQVPVLIIAALAGPEAGFLMLALRVMAAPMSLLGSAISQVYQSRMREAYRDGRLGPLTAEVVRTLFRVGVGPILFAGIAAPALFPVVFGAEWLRAGEIVTWVAPWIAMNFLASPVSTALHVTNRLPLAMGLQLAGMVLRGGGVVATAFLMPERLSEVYALTGLVFYVVYLAVVIHVSGARVADLMRGGTMSLGVVLIWGGAGWIMAAAL